MNDFGNCTQCGYSNQEEAKFCAHCGEKLPLLQTKSKICVDCGSKNPLDSRFCVTCGNVFSGKGKKHSPKKNKNKKKKYTPKTGNSKSFFFISASVLTLVFLSMFFIDNERPSGRVVRKLAPAVLEQKSNDPVLEAKTMEIAAHFICSCGTCGEEPLEICTCQTAQAERNFIRQALRSGLDDDEVIKSVNQTYGWIKPEFKETYGKGKFIFSKESILDGSPLFTEKKTDAVKTEKLATMIDRLSIISHFACPCGRCEDELKDCQCEHPRGAREVKDFIDKKIAKGEYTKDYIVSKVEQQYGGRIM